MVVFSSTHDYSYTHDYCYATLEIKLHTHRFSRQKPILGGGGLVDISWSTRHTKVVHLSKCARFNQEKAQNISNEISFRGKPAKNHFIITLTIRTVGVQGGRLDIGTSSKLDLANPVVHSPCGALSLWCTLPVVHSPCGALSLWCTLPVVHSGVDWTTRTIPKILTWEALWPGAATGQ